MARPGSKRLKRILTDIRKTAKQQWNKANTELPTEDSEAPPTIITAAQLAYLVSNQATDAPYVLYRSFILDSGATAHVCNDLTRFKQFRATGPQDFLFAG